jgi:hypothetical protein
MTSTILQKLTRLKSMVEAETNGESWWTNPNGHPQPTLPDQNYLEGKYLIQIEASCPNLMEKACDLVSFAGKERRG